MWVKANFAHSDLYLMINVTYLLMQISLFEKANVFAHFSLYIYGFNLCRDGS